MGCVHIFGFGFAESYGLVSEKNVEGRLLQCSAVAIVKHILQYRRLLAGYVWVTCNKSAREQLFGLA